MRIRALSVLLVLVGGLAACGCLASAAQEDVAQPGKPTKPRAPLVFRVSGSAQASPETATVHFAIVGDGDTLSAAKKQMQDTERAIVTALEKQGVKRKDLQLEGFAATPLQPGGINSSTTLKPLGYRVQRQYQITMPAATDSLESVLSVAEAAMSQGARPVMLPGAGYDAYDRRQPSLMEFAVKDRDKLVKLAMSDALSRARKLAEEAAGEMGYQPGALKLVAVNASDVNTGTDRYDSPEERVPATSPTWQPVKVVVFVEAEFEVK